jgi:outer membrane putative beta-barrel porin/alpha-amylase
VLRFPLGIVLALTMAAALRAQCKESDFPDPAGPVAAPTRPTESFPGDPVQTGVLQLESGFTHTWDPHGSSQNDLPTMVRFGVWCGVELRWNANVYASDTASSVTNRGFGDNYLGGQYRFVRESAHMPSLAFGYTIKFATANAFEGLGSGKRDHIYTLMAGKTIHGFSILMNASYFSIGQPAGGSNGKGEWTLAVSHALKGRLGAVGEVYRDSRLNAANVGYTDSTWAFTYNVSRRVVIDLGTYVGLTSGAGAPGKSAFAGVTYAIANLYPPRPRLVATKD